MVDWDTSSQLMVRAGTMYPTITQHAMVQYDKNKKFTAIQTAFDTNKFTNCIFISAYNEGGYYHSIDFGPIVPDDGIKGSWYPAKGNINVKLQLKLRYQGSQSSIPPQGGLIPDILEPGVAMFSFSQHMDVKHVKELLTGKREPAWYPQGHSFSTMALDMDFNYKFDPDDNREFTTVWQHGTNVTNVSEYLQADVKWVIFAPRWEYHPFSTEDMLSGSFIQAALSSNAIKHEDWELV